MCVDDFTTERLAVRSWRPDIEDAAKRRSLEGGVALLLTPRVLEYLPEPLQISASGGYISDWIFVRANESDVFLVRDIPCDHLVGLLILASTPEPSGVRIIHLGYLFAETAWGNGYATELVCGLTTALAGKDPVRLVGGVGKGNAASARVLVKAGFQLSTDLSTPDTDMLVRSIP